MAKNAQAVWHSKGSFFQRSHFMLSLIHYLYYSSIELPNAEIQFQLEIDDKTLTDWTNMVSKLCSMEQLANRIWLGGPPCIVAIDETLATKCINAKNLSV